MKSTAHPLAGDPLGIPPGAEGRDNQCRVVRHHMVTPKTRVSEWHDIASAPRDGTWFLIGGHNFGPEEYEVGKYDPQIFTRYEDAGNGLFRKVDVVINEWRGFNNFERATHWHALPEQPLRA